jgi:DNA-binding SARP family transcriptional activator/tetratricopeptide (TPR) repeat protein
MDVGAQLREHRRTVGLSQRELAERAGISLGSVRDLEQGRVKHPHQATTMRLVEALGLSGDESAGFIRECRARRSWTDARPGSGLKIRVLGALAGWRSGVAFALGPPRQRAVLGLLALHPGQALHRDVIIDALWGDRPPASAVDLLHTHVSRLRHLLEPGRPARDHEGLLHCDGGSYRLELTGDELDLLAFRELARRGREAALAHDDDAACTMFSEALGLWHGEPLCDVQVLRGHPAVAAVACEHEEAVLGYAAAALSAGTPERARPYLRVLADREPLSEPVHAMLMQTLASGGDQAAALAVYDHIRRRLDDELGVRPGAVLAEAHSRVLHQQIPVAAARADPMSMYQLPSRIPDFTGRARECAVLTTTLVSSAPAAAVLVALVFGPPGVGKTTLAVHVAHSVRSSFPDGQLWVPLTGASPSPRDPGEVLSDLLRVLGLHGPAIPDEIAERAALLRSRLADKKMLLVADDAASAAQVLPLLPGTSSCAVIVTSRRRLAGLAGAAFVELEPFSCEEAVSLLDRIAGSGRVAAEPAAAADLVKACGLLPLAVRIAGSKLAVRPSWPVSVLTARVTEERRRLDELEAENLSVRASIATSYQSLPGQVKWAFRLLSLLGPGDVAEWVIAALLGVPDASQIVAELTDRCLLTPIGIDRTGQPRYRVHDLIRDFAAERAAGDPATDRRAALRRAAGAWLQLATLAAGRLPPEPFFPLPPGHAQPIVPDPVARRLTADSLAWFTAEHPNLPAAIQLACDAGWHELAADLAGRCASFWELRCWLDTASRSWAAVAHAARQADDRLAECKARLRQAAALSLGGWSADAIELLNSCIPQFDRSGELESLALSFYWRSYCYDDIDDLAKAEDDAGRGLLLARRAGSWLGEFMNLKQLGLVIARRGEYSEGLKHCERALSFADIYGIPYYQVAARYALAYAYILVGQYDRALKMARSVAGLAHRVGSVRLEVSALGIMGDAYQGLARYEEAAAVLLQALPRFRDHSKRRHHALCLLKVGYAYQAMSCYDEASRYFEQSLPIFRELRLPHYTERVLACLDECRTPPGL